LRQAARKSIGQALAELTAEFPDEDIKESKLRFLEAEGLVEPERTPSGYRKYSTNDMERLRYIIRAQREHYLPLKVIKEHLDAMDRGLEPPAPNGAPVVPTGVLGEGAAAAELLRSDRSDVRISRRELIKTAEITEELLDQLESFGLIHTRAGSRQHYDGDALVVARTAGALAAFGIEPRHLRAFKTSADREVGLVEQVVSPIRRSREDGAEGRAAQAMEEIAALSLRLHATLVRTGMRGLR
jgi:DNA-binding transcriptional MerR regulator